MPSLASSMFQESTASAASRAGSPTSVSYRRGKLSPSVCMATPACPSESTAAVQEMPRTMRETSASVSMPESRRS